MNDLLTVVTHGITRLFGRFDDERLGEVRGPLSPIASETIVSPYEDVEIKYGRYPTGDKVWISTTYSAERLASLPV